MSVRRRLEHLLVATDFSQGADVAIERAGRLPLPANAVVRVVHVVPSDIPRGLQKQALDRAKLELVAVAARLAKRAGEQVQVVRTVLRGTPFVEIIRHARSHDVDLVVMGRHGRRAVRDLFIGSTAERVVRKGDTPVLLVNQRARRGYARPVAAVDLTDTSRRAVQLALALAGPEPKRLTLLHAYSLPFESPLARTWSRKDVAEYRRASRQATKGAVKRFVASLEPLEVPLRVVVRPGDPRTVIIAELTSRRSDLVAVGTHARSGIAHALLGSVAEWVIRSARCDVAVTRPARFAFELP